MAVYGNTITYKYEEELEDGTTEQKELLLVFNPLTLVKYYNYVGREFMTDFFEVALSSKNNFEHLSKEVKEKIEKGEEITADALSVADIKTLNSIDYSAHMEFFLNTIATMIATREHPKKLDFAEIISSIPLMILYDSDFLNEMLSLITFGLKKKKIVK